MVQLYPWCNFTVNFICSFWIVPFIIMPLNHLDILVSFTAALISCHSTTSTSSFHSPLLSSLATQPPRHPRFIHRCSHLLPLNHLDILVSFTAALISCHSTTSTSSFHSPLLSSLATQPPRHPRFIHRCSHLLPLNHPDILVSYIAALISCRVIAGLTIFPYTFDFRFTDIKVLSRNAPKCYTFSKYTMHTILYGGHK